MLWSGRYKIERNAREPIVTPAKRINEYVANSGGMAMGKRLYETNSIVWNLGVGRELHCLAKKGSAGVGWSVLEDRSTVYVRHCAPNVLGPRKPANK